MLLCTGAIADTASFPAKLVRVVNLPGLDCLVNAGPEVVQGLQQTPVTGVGAQHIIDCPGRSSKVSASVQQ